MKNERTSRRVLVVDDENIIADSLALILKRSGFEAEAVYSGEMAIETARDLRPDVLICDVILRGITGVEAAIHIARILPTCRVILFSGQAGTSDLLQRAHSEGHKFEMIPKPVHPQVLLTLLGKTA
ncbi:MAG TPA: response regulator [Candidatus Sulfotelmatobacter sp.]|jgi:CheY-like chemotaxis protein|nr:response regulator [Candidatus Sulfotelmatobacter sp.]